MPEIMASTPTRSPSSFTAAWAMEFDSTNAPTADRQRQASRWPATVAFPGSKNGRSVSVIGRKAAYHIYQ